MGVYLSTITKLGNMKQAWFVFFAHCRVELFKKNDEYSYPEEIFLSGSSQKQKI